MSHPELSTAPRISVLVARSAIVSAIFAVVIYVSMGPAGRTWVFGQIAGARLHVPRLDLIAEAPLAIRVHLVTVLIAIAVATVQVFGPKGRTQHRVLGWMLAGLLMTTAVVSLFIHDPRSGWFNPFQLFSVWTLVAVPLAILAARRHNARRHGAMMAGLYFGGMIFAGVLTFMPGRLLWRVFFG